MTDRFDMTAMYAMHAALRRELEQIARIAAGTDDDPRRILASAVGWDMFKKALHIHHSSEDEALWPAMRESLAGRPDELAVVAAMEAEHGTIDPLIEAIDAAIADRDAGPERLGGLIDGLAGVLSGHLKHEEAEALPLVQASLTAEQWQHFGQVHASRGISEAPRLTPWLLDGADEQTVTKALAMMPEPVRALYWDQWQPAYAAMDKWRP